MNNQTLDVLGYNKVIQDIKDYARTERGKETIHQLKPMVNERRISQLLTEIEEAIEILKISSSVPIHTVDDIEQLITQGKKGLFIRADQFSRVLSFLDHCTKLKRFMKDKEYAAPTVSAYAFSIEDVSQLEETLSSALRNGRVDDYASKSLTDLRRQISELEDRMKARVQDLARGKKYATYLQDTVVSERQGRFVLQVKKEYKGKVPGTVMDTSASGSTVFVEPAEISSIQEELNLYKMMEEAEVERILFELTAVFLDYEHTLMLALDVMHNYDVLFAKAKYCQSIHGTRPILTDDKTMNLIEARHPELKDNAIPLSIEFGEEERALVITGPNTGGKTVTLKTVGLLTLMAQAGLLIPAKSGSKTGIFQQVFIDIGDGQSIEDNLSTFSSRLVSIIQILEQANDHSLVFLDELGSGTDPAEGMGLAIAILEQLYKKGATLFATTHYNEMKSFAEESEGFLNGSMEFDLETLKPTYRLLLGESGKSQAFEIALKLGLHPQIVEQAHERAYKESSHYKERFSSESLNKDALKRQITINRYADYKKKKTVGDVKQFDQGDNVKIQASDEIGIVYTGPDERGNYVIQVKGEKKTYNHKRLTLYIQAEDLYPEDYDFDIIFKSKSYRKIKNDLSRKHVDGLILEDEE
ncbi:DNA mismatch repair protein [Geomicrobium sp. JCM 19038]|uniref:endonuclease MutS2 n=1 Tax=Geomicrobium sp. JCM 19038 TaxID=1460635 RepID=UPI00045F2859|nr:DNA mismatch repair protein [Geomicrobium sp. JCM 19038]GAK09422.1 MutS2-related protein [Geomicrobium sp. JCM 19038]